jgi:O-antigen/teichoic acid export membrane protein
MRLPGRSGSPDEPGRSATSVEYGKTASFLAVGVGLTGVITYAYFLIASHVLSKPDYGQITVLWSAVFITISTLYRPIEQLLSRHISERLVKGEPIGQPMRVASTIQFGLSLFFAVVALALRGPIQDGVLEGNEALYWVFFTSVLFYAASYFARGFLAGEQRFGLFVAMILSESCFRTIFAVMVAIGILSGQSAVAIGITAAPALSLLVVPFAFARRAQKVKRVAEAAGAMPGMPGREAEDMPPSPDSGRNLAPPESGDIDSGPARPEPQADEFSLAHGGGFAAAVLLIMFSEQAFLNAGPLIVRGLEGAAAAGFIFNVLMLARAPLQLFQAVSTSILPHLTTLHHSDAEDAEREFHHTVRMVLLGISAFTVLVVVVVLIAGPTLMQIAFSKKFTYDRAGLLLVSVGMGLYLSSVTVNQACIAQGQVRRAAARWIACAALFIGWNFVPLISEEFRRVEVGFLVAAGALFSLLFYVYRHPRERSEDVPAPGSGEELEARLATLDENV